MAEFTYHTFDFVEGSSQRLNGQSALHDELSVVISVILGQLFFGLLHQICLAVLLCTLRRRLSRGAHGGG
jgi:hypothetical protein